MSAGLPGLGLGGIFFILSALIAPLREGVRWARGESSPAGRRTVARQFALALAMIVAVDLTLRASLLLLSVLGVTAAPSLGLIALPLTPLAMTLVLMLAVLAGAKALALLHARRAARRRASAGRRELASETV